MKRTLIALTLLATLAMVSAQDKLPRNEALKLACLVSADLKQLQGTPLATDVDIKYPVAIRQGEYGGMVLPEAKLTRETLAKAGSRAVPVGQLWLLKLTPMKDGEAISSDKLRLATLPYKNEQVTVPQCALGVRRSGAGALELLVYGKDKEPLLALPLQKINQPQDTPIDLEAEAGSASGTVTLKILGTYETKLQVTELP